MTGAACQGREIGGKGKTKLRGDTSLPQSWVNNGHLPNGPE
jgi:hypothetical protein